LDEFLGAEIPVVVVEDDEYDGGHVVFSARKALGQRCMADFEVGGGASQHGGRGVQEGPCVLLWRQRVSEGVRGCKMVLSGGGQPRLGRGVASVALRALAMWIGDGLSDKRHAAHTHSSALAQAGELVEGTVIPYDRPDARTFRIPIDLGDGIMARINQKRVTSDPGGISQAEYHKLFPPGAKIKALVLGSSPVNVALTTAWLERRPGEMLRDPGGVYTAAAQTAFAGPQLPQVCRPAAGVDGEQRADRGRVSEAERRRQERDCAVGHGRGGNADVARGDGRQ